MIEILTSPAAFSYIVKKPLQKNQKSEILDDSNFFLLPSEGVYNKVNE